MKNTTPIKILTLASLFAATACWTAAAADASALWAKDCAMCHGKDGKGDTKAGQMLHAPDFTDAKTQAKLKDDTMLKAIKEGIKDKDGRLKMKAFPNLSDEEAKALVQHVRSFKK